MNTLSLLLSTLFFWWCQLTLNSSAPLWPSVRNLQKQIVSLLFSSELSIGPIALLETGVLQMWRVKICIFGLLRKQRCQIKHSSPIASTEAYRKFGWESWGIEWFLFRIQLMIPFLQQFYHRLKYNLFCCGESEISSELEPILDSQAYKEGISTLITEHSWPCQGSW